MHNRFLKVCLSSLILASLVWVPAASANDLSCAYGASWKGNNGKGGNFSWKGFWFEGDGGWIFRANGEDTIGKSKISGACGDGECHFHQVYITGTQKGKWFYYLAKYAGKLEQGPKNLRFTGEWRIKEDSPKPDGTWQAMPACKPSTVKGDDIPKALGWKDWDDDH